MGSSHSITIVSTAVYGTPKVASRVFVQGNQFADGYVSIARTNTALVPA